MVPHCTTSRVVSEMETRCTGGAKSVPMGEPSSRGTHSLSQGLFSQQQLLVIDCAPGSGLGAGTGEGQTLILPVLLEGAIWWRTGTRNYQLKQSEVGWETVLSRCEGTQEGHPAWLQGSGRSSWRKEGVGSMGRN